MPDLQIVAVFKEESGRVRIRFDSGTEVALYKGEIRGISQPERGLLLKEGGYISEDFYQKVVFGIVGRRARKRAMYLLEKMDRTEQQLFDKLRQSGYPKECVEDAIGYVKRYQYIDDLRYAKSYIRFRQDKKSRQKLRVDLMAKGVAKDVIEIALQQEFDSDEQVKIRQLLEKRHYDPENCDQREMQRNYQFLMRRGFKSSDILHVMKNESAYDEF